MPHAHYDNAFNPSPGKGELTVLFSGHAQTMAGHRVGPQVLDYYLIHTVVAGQGVFRCRNTDYRLGPGHSFVIFPGELVRYDCEDGNPWKYRWAAFKGARAEELLAVCGLTRNAPTALAERPRRMNALYHKLEQSLRGEGQLRKELAAGGVLRLILAEYSTASAVGEVSKEDSPVIERQIEQAIRWLTLQYYQPISIEEMAKSLGYHRTHLSKMFKQHTGLSPMQYLLKVRMERAKLLLQESLTVEQVASSIGFADPLYFSKQFKKCYGLTPSEYRQDLHNPYNC
ncbi:AraC-type DNA-binding protein [Paenibacillus sp. UNCCL117]|uniref:AraC family transcriptional regulator n=1 Tax=unclassified Paenibacillus TaxID=185978 RepID=UPI000890F38A|nr:MULTISPECIES: AraC family transcriptional regulator [unclassified Paenibacillus]SDC16025.1 AraC-type DNA-binding protein [Paenibacillus sp. cl123]SFW17676.1 AraC-type DNA-binding protein [Paenibacillus sp. UNCCL117]